MAWIELHQSLVTHHKLKRFSRETGAKRPHCVGYVACLWLWALDNAPDGDLTDINPDDIKEAACWPKAASELMSALTVAGFIDQTDDGKLILHDWDQYAGKLVTRREKDADRKREARRTSSGHPADGVRTADGRRTDGVRTNQPYQPTNQPAPDQPQVGATAAPSKIGDARHRCIVAYDELVGSAAAGVMEQRAIDKWLESASMSGHDLGEWFEEACAKAALKNAKNLKYVLSILEREGREGRGSDTRVKGNANGRTGDTAEGEHAAAALRDLESRRDFGPPPADMAAGDA